jgi:hypothetical protein
MRPVGNGANQCRVCASPERDAIEQACLTSASNRDVAACFGVKPGSVHTHRTVCMPALVQASSTVTVAQHAQRVREHAERCLAEAKRLQASAESQGDIRTALLALREYARGAELLLKDSESSERIDVTRSEQWIGLRDAIMGALVSYPDALRSVMHALDALRAGQKPEKTPLETGGILKQGS